MYQALYRKWRPKTFDDVVGQEHITTTLRNEFAAGKPAHAYLLMGSRGTGKTTCAKLIAKAVNCLEPQNGSPCGRCDVCIGIDNGSMVDVVEIDAASNNGVDNIRDLRDEAHFLPNVTRYRVYIIDEAHMLSIGAVNALLKIMEEPPAHVIFILATTEIHKMPATIQSRCQRFDFNRIDSTVIAGRLKTICAQEGIVCEDEALTMIARLADGGMRDAISLLDLCSAYSEGVTVQTVSRAAGLIGQEYLFDIVDAVCAGSLPQALETVGNLSSLSVEYDRLCQQLVTHCRNLLVAGSVKKPENLIICLPETLKLYQKQAKKAGNARILYLLRTLQETAALMSRTTSRRTEMELCFAKLCDPRLATSPEALISRIEELEARISVLAAGAAELPAPKAKLPSAEPKPPRAHTAAAPEMPPESESLKPAPPVPTRRKSTEAAAPAPPQAEGAASAGPPPLFAEWDKVLERLGKSNPALRGALLGSKAYHNGSRVLVDSGNPIFLEMMRTNDYTRQSLKQAITEVTGARYSIGPYERPSAAQAAAYHPLDDVLQAAADSGIEVKTL